MKRIRKPLSVFLAIVLLLGVLWAAPLTPSAAEEGDYTYEVVWDEYIEIQKYNGKDENVVVPDKIEGKEVLWIGDACFVGNVTIKSVMLPDTVVSIGNYAFSACTNLRKAEIGSGVRSIGECAFERCTNLRTINLDKVNTFYDDAFLGCRNLTTVTLEDSETTDIRPHALGFDYADEKIDDFTIRSGEDSAAEKYAKENSFIFELTYEPIRRVNLTITPPKYGEIPETMLVPAEQFDSMSVMWYNEVGDMVSEFDEALEYKVVFELTAKPGYAIVKSAIASVNGNTAKIAPIMEDYRMGGAVVTYTFPRLELPFSGKPIEEVNLTVDAPVAGLVCSFAPNGAENCSIEHIAVEYAGEEFDTAQPIEEGMYNVYYILKADDGFVFHSRGDMIETDVTVNGQFVFVEPFRIEGAFEDPSVSEYAYIKVSTFFLVKKPSETDPTPTPTIAPGTPTPTTAPGTPTPTTAIGTPTPTTAPETPTPTPAPNTPTPTPTQKPSPTPTKKPTPTPTKKPTPTPTRKPTPTPVPKKNISKWTVQGIKDKTYTGKALKQSIKVVSAKGEYADFTAAYANNINVGTATVKISGKGNYKGTITKTFKINKAANPLTVTTATKTVKLSTIRQKAVTVKNAVAVTKNQGKLSYTLTAVSKDLKNLVTISSNGVITIKKWAKAKKGTYGIKVKVTAKGNANYKSGAKTVTVKIKVQ